MEGHLMYQNGLVDSVVNFEAHVIRDTSEVYSNVLMPEVVDKSVDWKFLTLDHGFLTKDRQILWFLLAVCSESGVVKFSDLRLVGNLVIGFYRLRSYVSHSKQFFLISINIRNQSSEIDSEAFVFDSFRFLGLQCLEEKCRWLPSVTSSDQLQACSKKAQERSKLS
ncbi:hypothetical protein CDAR_563771 [Caerostris darwini]|uniref:Uncharacterized protein n=1 Tax=Caerostris darwini TaxID=1538125 RepID=A0AAV4UYQ1_9ARAC|nr:hypothetical protein CDAR_563771 [Caerostris darwini]